MPVLANYATPFTVGYLVNRTFDLLLGSDREEMNRLTSEIGATTTTITVDFQLGNLTRGTYLGIDDEVLYVWDSTQGSGNSTVTVQRGMKGTTAVGHAGQSLVFVNPYFTRYQVRQTLREVVRSWAPQVFAVKTLDIQLQKFVRGYDLGDIAPWFDVLRLTLSPNMGWSGPDPKDWKSISYRTTHSANTSTFPSGNSLTITEPGIDFGIPRTLHLVYGNPINVDTTFNDGDNLLQMGMDSSDLDIAPYGAAAQLAMGREMRRMLTEAQGNVADLQQFPPGYAVSAAQKFKTMHDNRLQDAVSRLRAEYPIRRTR